MKHTAYFGRRLAAALLAAAVALTFAACGSRAGSQVAGADQQVIYGYVLEVNDQARTITVDPVELISGSDTQRLSQLGVNAAMSEGGSYAYNARRNFVMYSLDPAADFDFNDRAGGSGNGSAASNGGNNGISGNSAGNGSAGNPGNGAGGSAEGGLMGGNGGSGNGGSAEGGLMGGNGGAEANRANSAADNTNASQEGNSVSGSTTVGNGTASDSSVNGNSGNGGSGNGSSGNGGSGNGSSANGGSGNGGSGNGGSANGSSGNGGSGNGGSGSSGSVNGGSGSTTGGYGYTGVRGGLFSAFSNGYDRLNAYIEQYDDLLCRLVLENGAVTGVTVCTGDNM